LEIYAVARCRILAGRWRNGVGEAQRGVILDFTVCSDKLISSLIVLFIAGVNKGYLDDAQRLLTALQIMRPRFRELQIYDAWLLIARKEFSSAAKMLRTLECQPMQKPFGAYVSALLAICLSSLRDPSWRIYANEVVARDEDEESVLLVNLLMGVKPEPRQLESTEVNPGLVDFAPSHFLRA